MRQQISPKLGEVLICENYTPKQETMMIRTDHDTYDVKIVITIKSLAFQKEKVDDFGDLIPYPAVDMAVYAIPKMPKPGP